MPRNPADTVDRKRTEWQERTARALDVSVETVRPLLSIPRQQSFLINTLHPDHASVITKLGAIGWQGEPISWCSNGYSIDKGLAAVKASPEAVEGSIYIQNAASWLPVLALDPQPGERILDVCAAPGGKTAHIAAATSNQAHITANDNSRPRMARLKANLNRLGVKDVEYSLYDATSLARKYEGPLFDKILLDAPCSGEGMMTLESDKDFATWSVAHIKRLQQLQKKIVLQAWQLLRPGGVLVYSTCTMAPEENEAVVDYLLRRNNNAIIRSIKSPLPNIVPPVMSWNGRDFNPSIQFALRLIPAPEAEAFFVAKIEKLDTQPEI